MKNRSYKLYFIVIDGQFKMGFTQSLKTRVQSLGNQFGEEINLHESFYYEVPEGVGNSLESSLKNKYKDHVLENEHYKTEIFSTAVLELMEEDVIAYHELFNFEISRKPLLAKYALVYDDDGKLKVQLTKRLKQIYDIFKGKEEYFEHLFESLEEEE